MPRPRRRPGEGTGGRRDEGPVAGQAGLDFGGLLRQLRDDARLTQEELAEAAQVSPRAVSDLERGINRTAARKPRCCWPARWDWTGRHAICSLPRPAGAGA